MPLMKKIVPKDGMRIRIPAENYRVMPPEGAVVQWSMHWARAEARGEIDVSDVEEAKDEGKGKRKGNPEVSKEVKTPGVAAG